MIGTASASRQNGSSSTVGYSNWSHRFFQWLVLPPGYTDVIRRMLGGAGIFYGSLWPVCFRKMLQPYFVPTLAFGPNLINLPPPSPGVLPIVATAYFVSCFGLLLGYRNKVLLLVPFVVLTYYASMEILYGDYILSMLCITLFFDSPKRSLTRRLIQLVLGMFYGFSALQKLLFPGFLSGDSLEAFAHERWVLYPFWSHVLMRLNPPHEFFFVVSWGAIILESFLAFAFFFKETRRMALWAGIIFHFAIAITMNVGLISLIMTTLYFAFLERRKEPISRDIAADYVANHPRTVAIACSLILIWFLVPLRIYAWPAHPFTQLSMADRRVHTYAYFVVDSFADPKRTSAFYEDSQGVRHAVALQGRMRQPDSDNELYAMCQYIRNAHPEATRVMIDTWISMNRRWWRLKRLRYERGRYSIDYRSVSNAEAEATLLLPTAKANSE